MWFHTSYYVFLGWTLIFIVVVSYKRFKANLKNQKADESFWNRKTTLT